MGVRDPRGEYGLPDPELGHRNAASVTLRTVAPRAGDKVRCVYDFGDDWQHDVVVEAVGPSVAGVGYPRCTGGRRAAPPEDCGGVWGYADLLEILGDPRHGEHAERLEWLGLDAADGLDPLAFDVEEVNRALAAPGKG